MISLKFSREAASLEDDLNRISKQEHRSLNNLIERVLLEYVKGYSPPAPVRISLPPVEGVKNQPKEAKMDKPKQAAKEVVKTENKPEVKINKEAASKPISPGIAPNGKPYQFEGIKWLDSSIYTAYPMNEKPTNYAMQDKWLKEKAASDAEIRRQYDEYISKNP